MEFNAQLAQMSTDEKIDLIDDIILDLFDGTIDDEQKEKLIRLSEYIENELQY